MQRSDVKYRPSGTVSYLTGREWDFGRGSRATEGAGLSSQGYKTRGLSSPMLGSEETSEIKKVMGSLHMDGEPR
jgi:hypothetical protein